MKLSRERLLSEAGSTGFRPEILEKAIHLLTLLDGIRSHPFLKGRLILKGGTALNLFVFDLPRLSMDIDLNYVGSPDRDVMLSERPKIEEGIRAVCSREGFNIRRLPEDHAGGKWFLRYDSALGQPANLELDINFLFRVPLWPVTSRDSQSIGSYKVEQIPVLDIHELAAGKLAALFSRHASRDLFDVHQLLTRATLEAQRLRPAFVAYGAMNRKDWRMISIKDVGFEANELENSLVPTLHAKAIANLGGAGIWAKRLLEECTEAMTVVLPFSEREREFLDRLLDHGEINPAVLTNDEQLAERIRRQPWLEWKAINVRQCRKE